MVEIDTLFQTKTAKKNIPFTAAHTFIAYIRDYSPGAKNALQIMSLAAYASETNDEVTLRDYVFPAFTYIHGMCMI